MITEKTYHIKSIVDGKLNAIESSQHPSIVSLDDILGVNIPEKKLQKKKRHKNRKKVHG